jgi:hypothetical protein
MSPELEVIAEMARFAFILAGFIFLVAQRLTRRGEIDAG